MSLDRFGLIAVCADAGRRSGCMWARLPLNSRRHEYVGKFPTSIAGTMSELRAVVREPGESCQNSRQLQVMTKLAGRRQEAMLHRDADPAQCLDISGLDRRRHTLVVRVGQHDDLLRGMARHFGDMVDRVEEIGMAGDIGGPAALAVSLCHRRISRRDHCATDIVAAREQRGHEMAAAGLADEIEATPAKMRLEPGERRIDQRDLARPPSVEMATRGTRMPGRARWT